MPRVRGKKLRSRTTRASGTDHTRGSEQAERQNKCDLLRHFKHRCFVFGMTRIAPLSRDIEMRAASLRSLANPFSFHRNVERRKRESSVLLCAFIEGRLRGSTPFSLVPRTCSNRALRVVSARIHLRMDSRVRVLSKRAHRYVLDLRLTEALKARG